MDKQKGEQKDIYIQKWLDGQMDGWRDIQMYKWIQVEQKDRWIDRKMDRWIDGWIGGWKEKYIHIYQIDIGIIFTPQMLN